MGKSKKSRPAGPPAKDENRVVTERDILESIASSRGRKRYPDREDLRAMADRVTADVEPYAVQFDEQGKISPAGGGVIGGVLRSMDVFGTRSHEVAKANLGTLEWLTRQSGGKLGDSPTSLNAALALVAAIKPENELEAALAVQIAGCQALTTDMMGRMKHAERTDQLERYGNMAIKLQRTFTAQIEALARLRGKGQQTVRVEHVTVHPGAQAIVGDVHHHSPRGPGGQSRSEESPYEASRTAAVPQTGAALPCPDSQGFSVPIPSDAERPVPHPRRTVARRARQSERAQARVLEPRDDRDATHAADDAT